MNGSAERSADRLRQVTVAVMVAEFPPQVGGIGTLTSDYVRWLSRRFNVVLFLHPSVPADASVPEGVQATRLDGATPWGTCKHILDSGAGSVLFSHMSLCPPLLVLLLRLLRIKTAVLIHGMDIQSQSKIRLRLRRSGFWVRLKTWLSFALQNSVIANSGFTLGAFRRRYSGLDGCVVHPGIWLDATSPSGAKTADIISVGRIVARKGVDVMLRALGGLQGVTATIVGDGPEYGSYQEMGRSLDLEKRVHFTGGLPHAAALVEIARHRIFCLLPRELKGGDVEGFGIVFLEAAALGLPVIAGRSGGVPDAVNDGVNGFLVDPEDPAEAAEKIRRLLEDGELYARMSRASLEWAARFDWERRDPAEELAFLVDASARRRG